MSNRTFQLLFEELFQLRLWGILPLHKQHCIIEQLMGAIKLRLKFSEKRKCEKIIKLIMENMV